jgi:hypothetical protein
MSIWSRLAIEIFIPRRRSSVLGRYSRFNGRTSQDVANVRVAGVDSKLRSSFEFEALVHSSSGWQNRQKQHAIGKDMNHSNGWLRRRITGRGQLAPLR